jgi:ABC-type polysaccharide/polyol phosphate export permease
VPVFYPFEAIPHRYAELYQLNPVAAMVLCLRAILMKAEAPYLSTLLKLASVSVCTFALGLLIFHKGKRRFYEFI